MIELKEDQLNDLIELQSAELNAQYEKDLKALTDKLSRDKKKLRAKVKQHYEQLLNKPAPAKKKKAKTAPDWTPSQEARLIEVLNTTGSTKGLAKEFNYTANKIQWKRKQLTKEGKIK